MAGEGKTKRKHDNTDHKKNKKERKRDHIHEKIVEKIRKKIYERLRRENKDQSDFLAGESLMFSKIAYDLSRSGTQDQMNEIELVSPTILNLLHNDMVQSLSSLTRIQQCYYFSESAFLLALSGVKNIQIYRNITRNILVLLSNLNVNSKDEIQLFIDTLEHLALSGMRTYWDDLESGFRPFYSFAQSIYRQYHKISDMLTPCLHLFLRDMISDHVHAHINFGYWLHSPGGGPLMALWLHSTKQKKVRCLFDNAPLPPGTRKAKLVSSKCADRGRSRVIWGGDSPLGFSDMTLPLVIDVGCGFGVSLLGIAAMAEDATRRQNAESQIGNWNCLGCDLSSHCVHYAQSISERWNLSHRCRFCVAPAEDFVEWINNYYPGPIIWMMVQFPTPYALQSKSHEMNRNIQLPTLVSEGDLRVDDVNTPESGFMVTPNLIETLSILLARKYVGHIPRLYFQSNVEDVAVTIKHKVESKLKSMDASFHYISESEEYCPQCDIVPDSPQVDDESRTQRQDIWESLGGEHIEIGSDGWLQRSPLPIYCRTETEAAYARMNKPVYRIGWELR